MGRSLRASDFLARQGNSAKPSRSIRAMAQTWFDMWCAVGDFSKSCGKLSTLVV